MRCDTLENLRFAEAHIEITFTNLDHNTDVRIAFLGVRRTHPKQFVKTKNRAPMIYVTVTGFAPSDSLGGLWALIFERIVSICLHGQCSRSCSAGGSSCCSDRCLTKFARSCSKCARSADCSIGQRCNCPQPRRPAPNACEPAIGRQSWQQDLAGENTAHGITEQNVQRGRGPCDP